VIGAIVADESVLEVKRSGQQAEPLRFEIHRLTLREVGSGKAMSYRVELRNPEPCGEVQSEGRFGPPMCERIPPKVAFDDSVPATRLKAPRFASWNGVGTR
jgi:hypothetical protein